MLRKYFFFCALIFAVAGCSPPPATTQIIQIRNATAAQIKIFAYKGEYMDFNFSMIDMTTQKLAQIPSDNGFTAVIDLFEGSFVGYDSVQIVFDDQRKLTHLATDLDASNNIINTKNFVSTGTIETKYYFKKSTQKHTTYTITDADLNRAK